MDFLVDILAFFVEIIAEAIYWVVYVFTYPIRLLPDATLSDSVEAGISTATTFLSPLDDIIPLSTIFAVLGLVITIEGAIIVYKVIMWIVRRLPTQS